MAIDYTKYLKKYGASKSVSTSKPASTARPAGAYGSKPNIMGISDRYEMRQIIAPPISNEVGLPRVAKVSYRLDPAILDRIESYSTSLTESETVTRLKADGLIATLKDVRFARSLLGL